MQEKKNRKNTPYNSKDIGFIERKVCNKISVINNVFLNLFSLKVCEYLQKNTSCTSVSQESIQDFLEKSQYFDLTPQERLQIVNICPTTLVEIYLIIENCESRLGQERAEELLYLAKETLFINNISSNNKNHNDLSQS